MVSEVNAVRDWLKSTWKISVPDDWLKACIEWVHSDKQRIRTTLEDLCNLVFEQWLVCDLREIGSSCLPPALSQYQKYNLNGSYGLQMNSIVDVGISFYGQIQKIQGTENDSGNVSSVQVAWGSKPSRMLMLNLTDGVQEVKAMEYKLVTTLNVALVPGTKIVVLGNILCRHGVLMLREENVRVLGGEVDSLLEENNADKILTRSLQCNINLSRPKIPKKVFAVDGQETASNVTTVASLVKSHRPLWTTDTLSSNKICLDDVDDIPDDDLITVAASVYEFNTDQFNDDKDFDYLTTVESQAISETRSSAKDVLSDICLLNEKTVGVSVAKQLSSLDFQKDVEPYVAKKMKTESFNGTFYGNAREDDNDFNWETSLSSVFKTKQKEMAPGSFLPVFSAKSETLSSGLCEKAVYSQQKPRHEVLKEQRISVSRVLPSAEVNDSISLDHKSLLEKSYLEYNSMTDPNCHSAGSVISEEDINCIVKAGTLCDDHIDDDVVCIDLIPFTYLNRILDQGHSRSMFRIKAFISTLVSRLDYNQGSHWSLVVKINDGSAAVDVQLGNEVLEQLIGFSASDCMKMKQISRTDKVVKLRLTEGIKKCQETLVQLSTIMEVDVSSVNSLPLVHSFHPVNFEDEEALLQRVKWCQTA